MIKGIDVSKYNGDINWGKVKNAGIEFAIIRCGYGDNITKQDDEYFERNYNECKRLGIKVGTYLYSYADTIEHAKSEAEHTLRLIKDKIFEYGIWYDLEDENTIGKCSNEEIAEIAKIYCDLIEQNGNSVGIYANKNWFTNRLVNPIFNNYKKWCASYGKNDGNVPDDSYKYNGEYMIWQYTSMGKVDGINGNVDLDICYEEVEIPSTEPSQPENKKIDVIYQTYTNGRWQPNVKNTEDYAGVFGLAVTGVYANLSEGNIIYKVHTKNDKWLPEVTDREDYAGILNKQIDGLMMKSNKGTAKYRVHILNKDWLPWVTGYDEKDSNNGYAGILGQEIDAIQIEIMS